VVVNVILSSTRVILNQGRTQGGVGVKTQISRNIVGVLGLKPEFQGTLQMC